MKTTQKAIKAQKKEIVNQTAINCGYYETVINCLPIYAKIEAIKQTAKLINHHTTDSELLNIIITEAVKACNFQDFKEFRNYFFNY